MFNVERKRLFVLLVFGVGVGWSLCTATTADTLEMNGLQLETAGAWWWAGTTNVSPFTIENVTDEYTRDVRIYTTGLEIGGWGHLTYIGNGKWKGVYGRQTLLATVEGPKACLPSDQESNVGPGDPPDAEYPYVRVGDMRPGDRDPLRMEFTLEVQGGDRGWYPPYVRWMTLASGGTNVTGQNRLPTAYGESVTTTVDTPVEITLHATDPDGDDLSFHVLKNPINGTLVGTPPNVTYTPNSGYTGADSFNFVARDRRRESNVATISITVGGDTGDWTTLHYPGASNTWAYGISGNNVVGIYGYAGPPYHSFLYNVSAQTWTALDFPGGYDTQALDIDGDNIVGGYDDASGVSHGFLYNVMTQIWATLDAPGASSTYAIGISGDNIVGAYRNADGYHNNFLFNGATWTILDPPDEWSSEFEEWSWLVTGIDGGNIVGYYGTTQGMYYHGFLYDGATWTILDAPGASATWAEDIDGGNIAGWCEVREGYLGFDGYHGFIFDGTTWTTLMTPMTEWPDTEAYGIDGNNVVGSYSDDDGWRGFLYSP